VKKNPTLKNAEMLQNIRKYFIMKVMLMHVENSAGRIISYISIHTVNVPCFLLYLFPALHVTELCVEADDDISH
jgi:hypothetical protein